MSAVVAGVVGRSVGRAFLLAQITMAEDAVEILRCCCLRRRESRALAGGVCGRRPGRSTAEGAARVYGDPSREGVRASVDMIAPDVAGYFKDRCEMESSACDA